MAQITPNSYQFGTPGLRTGSTIIRSFDNLRLRSTQYGSMEKKGMLLPIHECLILFMGATQINHHLTVRKLFSYIESVLLVSSRLRNIG